MKETTVVWAKLFLILLILAKPLGLKGNHECKHLGNNSCLSHSECCSGYCYREPGWELGVCRKAHSPEKPVESNGKKHKEHSHARIDDIYEKGVCGYYSGGEITANGDVFDENEMTAAHQTLPFDTMVNVETMGTSVVVKINDRKTAADGQVLLLSRAAAESMNIDENTGPVQCQLKLTKVGCIPNFGDPCVMHHECCSRYCFKEMYSEKGFCIPK
ncbi:uncharacterized protein LOC111033601 [Myzus persicae]|uniref:uncharacterized protein LOC111033601 n=1 Tax=Myzus persicae TaxID=13164 RepID=UPI000B93744B|nr:uncharacterized protein LOC111033601 [Myzus persicae]